MIAVTFKWGGGGHSVQADTYADCNAQRWSLTPGKKLFSSALAIEEVLVGCHINLIPHVSLLVVTRPQTFANRTQLAESPARILYSMSLSNGAIDNKTVSLITFRSLNVFWRFFRRSHALHLCTGWGAQSWTKTFFSLYRPSCHIEAYIRPEKNCFV